MLLATGWLVVMTGPGEGGPAAGGLPEQKPSLSDSITSPTSS